MAPNRKDQIRALLKSIETGDAASVQVVNHAKYIQHNPQTHEGGEGLAALFKRLSEMSPQVNIVRVFGDGDFVFAHTEYDFSRRNIGFEVFRFEGEQVVEHWDNIQKRKGPNSYGHSMVDGPTEATDFDSTEENRELVRSFLGEVLVGQKMHELEKYVKEEHLVEHSSELPLAAKATAMRYDKVHRVLAEGNFVLAVSEGANGEVHTSFYDLFRIAGGKVVEHWDTTEAIAPISEWKNQNGKF